MPNINITKVQQLKNVESNRGISNKESGVFSGVSTDTRTIKENELYFALKGDRFDGHDFLEQAFANGASGAVVEKAHKKALQEKYKTQTLFFVDNSLKSLQELASLYRMDISFPVIGVTGTNGKTTTKEMIYAVLSQKYKTCKNRGNLNNHIGVPLTVLDIDNTCQAAVIEMGANHPGEIALLSRIAQPVHAVITNVGAAHLEFFGSLKKVAETKAELLEYVSSRGTGIINGDDELLMSQKDKAKKIITYGLNTSSDVRGEITRVDSFGCSRFRLNGGLTIQLNVPGKVNVYNALAAVAAGKVMNISNDEIKQALENFKAENQRLEILEKSGMTIINDSYNANPDSVKSAIQILVNCKSGQQVNRIAVLGDMLELGGFSEEKHREVGEYAVQSGIDTLFTFGTYAAYISDEAKSNGLKNSFHFDSKEELVKKLSMVSHPGDIILLKGSRRMRMEDIMNMI